MAAVYVEPTGLAEATDVLARHGDTAIAIGGGTAYTVLLKRGLIRHDVVVGLRSIPELQGVRRKHGALWLGASLKHREVETSPLVHEGHAVVAETYGEVATVRIRNQATVGGGLAYADPAQDPPVTLVALGAEVVVAGPDGLRSVPIEALFVDYFTTGLSVGEIIVGVTVPPFSGRARYVKFLPASREDYATVGVAVALEVEASGRIGACSVALGGVGPVPIRARALETQVTGAYRDDPRVLEAAASVAGIVTPLDDVRGSASYKRRMAVVNVRRAIKALLDQEDATLGEPRR